MEFWSVEIICFGTRIKTPFSGCLGPPAARIRGRRVPREDRSAWAMKVTEYRIPMPMCTEQYLRGHLYSQIKYEGEESTGKGDGVLVLDSKKWEEIDKETGEAVEKGWYTRKKMFLKKKVPGYVRLLLPSAALVLEEESFSDTTGSHLKTKTVYKNLYFTSFRLTVETFVADDDMGQQHDPIGLDEERLRKRKIKVLDICDDSSLKKEDRKAEEDPTLVRWEGAEIGPLERGKWWTERESENKPNMWIYKNVCSEVPYAMLRGTLEEFITNSAMLNVLLKLNRKIYCLGDEWMHLTSEALRSKEKDENAKKEETLSKDIPGSDEDAEISAS